ncbi:MAG: hypothetical protein ACJA1A_001745 [Saprospiraceae bacterium]|jgi:hypothetical protein|tara:strand:- start:603 stop:1256 length:654 start_codon:yes stop_codon:yes gene_type:complete
MMKDALYAVITGDIVDSSSLSTTDRNVIEVHLNNIANKCSKYTDSQFDMFRGDSVQGVLKSCKLSLRVAVYFKAKTNAIRIEKGDRTPKVDIRLSIGIGKVDYLSNNILASDGPAFKFSGHTLDTMKKSGRDLTLTTTSNKTNKQWDIILSLMEEVMNGWSIASAETVALLLWDDNEKHLSKILGISQPAVNLRKKHARWDAIKKTIEYYEKQFARK